ncbi:MAG TPA: SDR family NAD(P)-dependent oxidoreductase [Segeticoccus sp.]|uniref:SDR family NAD(P)-dependent oxidoreductase n=1 Tax=Segeticoccus sp. TaxID=2706531 RepID=UPI002D7E67AD|nr:SDR family NAD(P)-dependent oxidoreductase [Segeticoccus sp.]HET8599157.1 SDR family NAD(P)-dependent oxidoreductase [Segeticoccus sp.]
MEHARTAAAVLVTGASSGIGRTTVQRLARRGDLTVWASARRPDSISDLAGERVRVVACDVTDEESMQSAVAAVEAEHGAVTALVNNAGYGAYGTIEETPLASVRRQFETNVFGLARMTQLVLPGMRSAGTGRIINISSMGGRLVFPVGGYYHASKYAVEAISDALRLEVGPFGISVSVVEPGLIRTGFRGTASQTMADSAGSDSPYAAMRAAAERSMNGVYRSRWLSAGPEAVAAVVERALTSPRPRIRYVVTVPAVAMVHSRRLFGARAFDAYVRRSFLAGNRR